MRPQWFRDARIATIYEGTNGIQAMDLVGRKLAPDGGREAGKLLDEAQATAEQLVKRGRGSSPALAAASPGAWIALAGDSQALRCEGADDQRAGGVAYLRLMALVRGAHHLGRGALAAPSDPVRTTIAAFFCSGRILPQVSGLAEAAMAGSDGSYAVTADRLAA